MPGSLPGGAADFINQWGDRSRVNIVDIDDIDDLNADHTPPESDPAPVDSGVFCVVAREDAL